MELKKRKKKAYSQLDVVAATGSIVPDFKSCDSTAIAFKQDELRFHVLFCYQKSSESGETAVMSSKTNCL